MRHHHHGFQQPGDSPHAEHGLHDHHHQGDGGQSRGIGVRPQLCIHQQDQLPGQYQHGGCDVMRADVGGNRCRDQQGRRHDAGNAPGALARCQKAQYQYQQAQACREMAMELFAPGLAAFHGALEAGVGLRDFVFVHRPGGAAVTGWPVGTAQAGIRQAHESAEYHDAQGQQYRDPGQAMEVLVRTIHLTSFPRSFFMPAGSKPGWYCNATKPPGSRR